MKGAFIFTEIVHCGPIGRIALESFFKFHPKQKVHVYGLSSDYQYVADFKYVVFHALDKPDAKLENWQKFGLIGLLKMRWRCNNIAKRFNHGHYGTASLWAHLIQTRSEKYIVHFDSDVVFRAAALCDIIQAFVNGYSLVGARRAYKNNPNNRDDVRHLPDITQTLFFGFDRSLVPDYPYETLVKMCQGFHNPSGEPVIDFFDPVAFAIIRQGGKVKILPIDEYGGVNQKGERKNKYRELNTMIDFGDKLAHFSAVGSGMNFYDNSEDISEVPEGYIKYGLEKYAVYMKLFYNQDVAVKIDKKKYAPLFKVKSWY